MYFLFSSPHRHSRHVGPQSAGIRRYGRNKQNFFYFNLSVKLCLNNRISYSGISFVVSGEFLYSSNNNTDRRWFGWYKSHWVVHFKRGRRTSLECLMKTQSFAKKVAAAKMKKNFASEGNFVFPGRISKLEKSNSKFTKRAASFGWTSRLFSR